MKLDGLKCAIAAVALGALMIPGYAPAGSIEDDLKWTMSLVNTELEIRGADYRLEMVEYLTAGDEQGRTVFFSDVGNKQLAFDFVPGDPRRTAWSGPVGPGDDITWASDLVEGDAGSGIGIPATQAAIMRAMGTWNAVQCSNLPLTSVAVLGDLGFLQFSLTGSGAPFPAADITQAGFGTPVDLFLPPPLIAATCTFIFIDASGNPTDIDNNGKVDAALREIYYTFNFAWGINTNFPIDVETVVLHETGHGLSQAHFGKLFRTDANGKLHFTPRAVMNAGYTGIQQQIGKTDNAGHCSNWANWPNK